MTSLTPAIIYLVTGFMMITASAQTVPSQAPPPIPQHGSIQNQVSSLEKTESLIKDIAALLAAVAALLWPIFAFTALFLFRPQIRHLLQRIKKGKLLGQEIELNETLVALQESAVAAATDVAALPAAREDTQEGDEGIGDDWERRVLETATKAPTSALLLLAVEIEKELFQLMASLGNPRDRKRSSIPQVFRELFSSGSLPKSVVDSVQMFLDIRNRLVHYHPPHGAPSTDDVLRAVDSGITILRALRAVPREVNTVYHPGVKIYSDCEARNSRDGVRGVILETMTAGGTSTTHRIFPTTLSNYRKGERVAWEWNLQKHFEESWYRDPDTQEIKYAWGASLEFVGRHLVEI